MQNIILFVISVLLVAHSSHAQCEQVDWGSGINIGNCACIIHGSDNDYTCCMWNSFNENGCPSRVVRTLGFDTVYYMQPVERPMAYYLECYYTLRCRSDLESSSSSAQSSSSVEGPPLTPPSSSSCDNRECCEKKNQTDPVMTDTLWMGCVAEDPTQDGCAVYTDGVTPGSLAYGECNAASKYQICTQVYMWSESAQQCGTLPTSNCIEYTVRDSMCTNVVCQQFESNGIGDLSYNATTGCYTANEIVETYLVCTNGTREYGGMEKRPWQVCQPYLDSLGIDVYDYLNGGNNFKGSIVGMGGIGGIGGVGGEGGDGGFDGDYSGGMPPGFEGGECRFAR